MAALHLSYLNEEEQNLICQVVEQEGKKIRPKQAEQLRKQNGKIDREAAENVFRCPEKSRAEKKTVKIWIGAGVYNAYLADVGEADVSENHGESIENVFWKGGVKCFQRGKLKGLDRGYFNIIMANDYDLTLMSKNTGHYWYLHNPEVSGRRNGDHISSS